MNAELRRSLWLDATPLKLLLVPVAIGLLMAVPFDSFSIGRGFTQLLLVAIGGIWGARRAAAAIPEEVLAGTWDSQRLSAMGPWALCWGKLAGALLLPWYAMLCVALWASWKDLLPLPDLLRTIGFTVLVQISALFFSLLLLRAAGRRVRAHATTAHVLAILVPIVPVTFLVSPVEIYWYGQPWERDGFSAVTLLVALAMALLGVYRAMREELQLRNLPWALAGSVLLLLLFFHGFRVDRSLDGATRVISVAATFSMLTGLLLATALLSGKDPVLLRRWLRAVSGRNVRTALELTPTWATTLAVGLLATVIFVAGGAPVLLALSTLGFAVRNVALVLALTVGQPFGRGHGVAVVVLLLLQGVLPLLLGPNELLAPAATTAAMAAGLLEAALAAGCAVWVLRRRLVTPS